MAHVQLDHIAFSYPLEHRRLRSNGGELRSEIKVFSSLTLEVQDGVRLGLVGPNGCGKTTLLRIIAGILEPTAGSIEVSGEVLPLINVRLGMEGELSGIENIRLRAAYLGRNHAAIEDCIPQIVEFAELGDFIEMPLNTYSRGMIARLAFAIATNFKPEILLMDESVEAGDRRFAAKAGERLREFVGKSNILVLASHNERLIKQMCNSVFDVSTGEMRTLG